MEGTLNCLHCDKVFAIYSKIATEIKRDWKGILCNDCWDKVLSDLRADRYVYANMLYGFDKDGIFGVKTNVAHQAKNVAKKYGVNPDCIRSQPLPKAVKVILKTKPLGDW